MRQKIPLDEIGTSLPPEIELLICTASFESRCLSIATRMAPRIRQAIIIRSTEFISSSEKHFHALQTSLSNKGQEVRVSSISPTLTADVFSGAVISAMKKIHDGTVLLDITTFTHEHLLILIALIQKHDLSCKIILGYTGAAEYSTNTEEDQVWLSRGVGLVRSVLGYPGRMAPSKKLHLIILVGFEVERARALIEIMEPSKVSLGVGALGQSFSQHHYHRNERFLNRVQEFIYKQSQVRTEVETFTFSCIDPYETQVAVLQQLEKHHEFNTVISPMNTKISTVGVGLAALQTPHIQVVYATVAEYNEEGYSNPGNEVSIFDWSRI